MRYLVTFLVVTIWQQWWWWAVAPGIRCVETTDASQHSPVCKTAPATKNYPAPNVTRAEDEKL